MTLMWLADCELTVREVVRASGPHPPRAYTTIMTTLVRLERKSLLRRTRVGAAFAYAPRQTRAEYVELVTREAVRALLLMEADAAVLGISSACSKREARRLAGLLSLVGAKRR